MIRYRNLSLKAVRKSVATPTLSEFGLSYVLTETIDAKELESVTEICALFRKSKSKCDPWRVPSTYSGCPNLVDAIVEADVL